MTKSTKTKPTTEATNKENAGTGKPGAEKVPYQPTASELTRLANFDARQTSDSPAPWLKGVTGQRMFAPEHPDKRIGFRLIAEAFGTADASLLGGLLGQLSDAHSHGAAAIDETGANFTMAVVKSIGPRDPLETMLAMQMATIHAVAMKAAKRFNNAADMSQAENAERMLNRLTRTFTSQMEGFKRYRSGVDQKVTVQNVSVNDGGQAIVGHVTQSPQTTASERPAPLNDARKSSFTIVSNSEREVVPPQSEERNDEKSSA